jgi:hypothetical protein
MTILQTNQLVRFGIDFDRVGAHTSRTLMLEELTGVLAYLDHSHAVKIDYYNAIILDNCLNKRTQANRKITYRDLTKLYTLEPSATIFRVLIYFWDRDISARPLLAILCAYCRDSLLRMTAPFVLSFSESTVVDRESLEDFIEEQQPGRFSLATLKSTSQNINASWMQSGHLIGRARKLRIKATATPASVAYALFFIG